MGKKNINDVNFITLSLLTLKFNQKKKKKKTSLVHLQKSDFIHVFLTKIEIFTPITWKIFTQGHPNEKKKKKTQVSLVVFTLFMVM